MAEGENPEPEGCRVPEDHKGTLKPGDEESYEKKIMSFKIFRGL